MNRTVIYTQSSYYIDEALMATTVLSLACLLKCRYFTVRGWSMAAGIEPWTGIAVQIYRGLVSRRPYPLDGGASGMGQ